VSAPASIGGHPCSEAYSRAAAAAFRLTSRIHAIPPLSALGTARAAVWAPGVFLGSGRNKMAKFEALAFTAGFVLTGLLSLVAMPLA
jgi:hypothetical protein